MQPKMCTKCKKNIAVVFITKVENGVTMNEGYCLKCARSLGIPQIDQAVKQMGISEDDLDMLADEMSSMFGQRDTVTSADSAQKDIVPKPAPKKQRRLPYTPPIPRNMLAQAAEANGISEDSMAVALEETEHLIKAMTVYQEIRVEEICNVEFEEEEYYY